MHANDKALGRNWMTADAVSMTDFGDCVRADFRWADGAWAYFLEDTKAEAIAHLAQLGFAPASLPA
jgi:hypothetical protein